ARLDDLHDGDRLTDDGSEVTMADANVTELHPPPQAGRVNRNAERQRRHRAKRKAAVTRDAVTPPPAVTVAPVTPATPRHGAVTVCTTVAALALAAVSAGFSITGIGRSTSRASHDRG